MSVARRRLVLELLISTKSPAESIASTWNMRSELETIPSSLRVACFPFNMACIRLAVLCFASVHQSKCDGNFPLYTQCLARDQKAVPIYSHRCGCCKEACNKFFTKHHKAGYEFTYDSWIACRTVGLANSFENKDVWCFENLQIGMILMCSTRWCKRLLSPYFHLEIHHKSDAPPHDQLGLGCDDTKGHLGHKRSLETIEGNRHLASCLSHQTVLLQRRSHNKSHSLSGSTQAWS